MSAEGVLKLVSLPLGGSSPRPECRVAWDFLRSDTLEADPRHAIAGEEGSVARAAVLGAGTATLLVSLLIV